MNSVLETLSSTLPRDSRDIVIGRFNALERQLDYLIEKQDRRVRAVMKKGWGVKRLKIVLALNSFYQTILSPLASSARDFNRLSPLSDLDILYGSSFRCDAEWRTKISYADTYFHEVLSQMGINRAMMIQQKTEDILYCIAGRSKDE